MRDVELKSRSMSYTIGNTPIDQRSNVLRDMREKFNIEEVIIYDKQLNILALSSANDAQIPVIPKYEDVEQIADRYLEAYATGKIDRLDVCYTKFLSIARQQATVETLNQFKPKLRNPQPLL